MSDTSTPAPTPLSEASPDSLQDIFNRDPRDLSEADQDRILVELRRQALQWAQDEQSGKTRASTKPRAAKSPATPPTPLSLDDF